MIEPPPIATNGNDAETEEIGKETEDLKRNNRFLGGRENGLLAETSLVRKFILRFSLRCRVRSCGMVETLRVERSAQREASRPDPVGVNSTRDHLLSKTFAKWRTVDRMAGHW